jgi:hypothetical protein
MYEKLVMTTQQTGQPSKSTKKADEDMKGQDTASTGFIIKILLETLEYALPSQTSFPLRSCSMN